jgi:hypothetical protein
MNKTLSLWLKVLTALGFLVCLAWAIQHPDFEPIAATLGTLTGFIALFIAEPRKPKPPTMRQRGGKDSTNYQAGSNMTINPKA